MSDNYKKYIKYKTKYLKLKNSIGGTLEKTSGKTKKYNSADSTEDTDEKEKRHTDATLEKGARTFEELKEKTEDDIKKAKKIRSGLGMAKMALSPVILLPGGTLLISTLNMAQYMQKAYTNNLKFNELLNDTMIILTNCYKIFMLINRSSDTFLIAIHNSTGLNELYNKMLKKNNLSDPTEIKQFDDEFGEMFQEELHIANVNKLEHRKTISGKENIDPHYLLYNIHQSNEIKREVKHKLKRILTTLLESAPDNVILLLYMDKTLKEEAFSNVVIEECKKRRLKEDISKKEKYSDDITFCMNPKEEKKSIEKMKEVEKKQEEADKKMYEETKKMLENSDKSENKGFLSRQMAKVKNVGTNLIDLTSSTYHKLKSSSNKFNKLLESEEKIQETLTLLSSLNGLFIVMKTQYDEVMKYYEKHLDNLVDNKDGNDILIKDRVLPSEEPTLYEKANYIVEFSSDYINFMVPPDLQSIVNKTINSLKSDEVHKKLQEEMKEALKEQKDSTQKEREETAIKEILEEPTDTKDNDK